MILLYNLEAQLNKEYLIKDLFYGVKYTISEIVPMNYTDFVIKNSKLVNLNKNIKNNKQWFSRRKCQQYKR